MIFVLLVLVGSLFIVPAGILIVVFFAALIDYLSGGGPAATTTGSNGDARPQPPQMSNVSGFFF